MKGNKLKKYSIHTRKSVCVFLTLLLLILSFVSVDVYAKKKEMSVKLNKKSQTIYIGEKVKIKAVIRYKTKGAKIVWKSSNRKVADVTAKGAVTGKKAGKAKIRAQIKGKKITATCVVTVKKKPVSATTPKPVSTPGVSPQASPGTEPDVSPQVSPGTEPGEISEETPSGEPQITPAASPDASPGISATDAPQDSKPTVTSSPSTPVVDVQVVKSSSGSETVYLLDRDYEGTIHISFCGKVFSASGKVKDALAILQTTYTTKTNHDETVRVSRVYPESCWTITDLETGTSYSMSVESRSSFESEHDNCGAIYFQGDVTSVISVY